MAVPRLVAPLPVAPFLAVLVLSILSRGVSAQSTKLGAWTWMGGSSTEGSICHPAGENGFYNYCGRPGVYGTLGVASATNVPGGRNSEAVWTDSSGDVWLFGGDGTDSAGNLGFLNDLWKFNPASNQWAWMGGSTNLGDLGGEPGVYGTLGMPAAKNVPGSRIETVAWTDARGHLWLFGGWGYDAAGAVGALADLWEFNPASKEWTWMDGSSTVDCDDCAQRGKYGTLGVFSPANFPAGRSFASGWGDDLGNLWLFGGVGWDSFGDYGPLNDVWEFDPSLHEWAWMGGSSTLPCNALGCTGEPAVYGTLDMPAAANTPGGRTEAVTFVDPGGNFWLFGGSETYGDTNDLWEFNTSTHEWAWMNGSAERDAEGYYGTLGVPGTLNVPGARTALVGWADRKDNLWLFGGSVGGSDYNDLWRFQPFTGEWTWMSGSDYVPNDCYSINGFPPCGLAGVYGDLGKAAAGNVPGTRDSGISWIDRSGNLWLFGGEGYDAAGNFGELNDLWRYQPPAAIAQTAKPVFSHPTGVYDTALSVAISDSTPLAVIYYTKDGTPPTATSAIYKRAIAVDADETVEAVAIAKNLAPSDVAVATFIITPPAAKPVFSPAGGDYPSPHFVAISDATAGAFIYYTTDKTTPTTASIPYTGPVAIMASQTIKAIAIADGYSSSAVATAAYTITPHSGAPGDWAWFRGGSTASEFGVYGFLGITSGSNFPGSRSSAVTWTDASGNLWLFGGQGCDEAGTNHCASFLNDLWEFSTGTKNWTWMGGNSKVYLCAGPYCGEPGFYGTLGAASAANVPGGRYGATGWTDLSGNFWLYGGYGFDGSGYFGYLDDLWRYSPVKKEWTWMGGSNSLPGYYSDVAGVYGTYRVAAAGNHPGSRVNAVGWVSKSGNIWLYGGYGPDSVTDYGGILGEPNDLWKFDLATREWSWMGGSSTSNFRPPPGVYGTLGAAAAGNAPGGRESAVAWTGTDGSFWLFGGEGYDSAGKTGYLNDLWEFSAATDDWTWMGGSDTVGSSCPQISGAAVCGQPGDYGKKGTAAAGVGPGSRIAAAAWTDGGGDLWLFGGAGFDSQGSAGVLNDLWEFNPTSKEWVWVDGLTTVPSNATGNGGWKGAYGRWGVPAAGSLPGSRSQALKWTDSNGNLWLMGGYGYDAAGTLGPLNDLWEYQR